MLNNKKPVILCVDDEQAILNTLNQQLRKRFGKQYHFEFAESAEEGLEIIDELSAEGHIIVMVITDQIMPGMSGDQFLAQVHARHPKLIKVLLTGQAALESAVNAINNANLYRYITKPWDEKDFLLTIEKGVGEYDLLNKLEDKNNELTDTLDVFKRFVPDQIQQRIAKEGIHKIDQQGPEEGIATILFSDIRSYTTYAETLTPTETLSFLNQITTALMPAIHQNRGSINQFVGDSIMAIFYDSFHESNNQDSDDAIQAAIAMQRAIDTLNRENPDQNMPRIQMGIGINSGTITTGTIGDASRMDAAVIGDAVNLASRMENLTRFYKQKILITTFTIWRLKNARRYLMRPIDLVRVKGKRNPVEIFEIFEADDPETLELKTKALPVYMEGLEAFRNLEWKTAEIQFLKSLKIFPRDPVVHLYLERCREFGLQPPPSSWDRVINMGNKTA